MACTPRPTSSSHTLLHEVLHLRDKLQKVSYQQKVHKWENDSDSQASDDDKDLMA